MLGIIQLLENIARKKGETVLSSASTNPALDPIGKIPKYKVCAVKVDAA